MTSLNRLPMKLASHDLWSIFFVSLNLVILAVMVSVDDDAPSDDSPLMMSSL